MHVDAPGGAARAVFYEARQRHLAGDVAQKVHDGAVAVGARAQDGVGVDDGGGLRPGEDGTPPGRVADLLEKRPAGEGVGVAQAQPEQQALIPRLLRVHAVEDGDLPPVEGPVLVVERRPRVEGERELGREPRRHQLFEHLQRRGDARKRVRDHHVAVAGDVGQPLGTEGLPVPHDGAHDLLHDRTVAAGEDGLLVGRQPHACCAGHGRLTSFGSIERDHVPDRAEEGDLLVDAAYSWGGARLLRMSLMRRTRCCASVGDGSKPYFS